MRQHRVYAAPPRFQYEAQQQLQARRIDARDGAEVYVDWHTFFEGLEQLILLRTERIDTALTGPSESGRVDRTLNRRFCHTMILRQSVWQT